VLEDQCETQGLKNNNTSVSASQGTPEWFQERIGKVTGSKAPAVIGLLGRKEFTLTWNCIKYQNHKKTFQILKEVAIMKSEAAESFTKTQVFYLKNVGSYARKALIIMGLPQTEHSTYAKTALKFVTLLLELLMILLVIYACLKSKQEPKVVWNHYQLSQLPMWHKCNYN
jgi:hypothetical protein